MDGKIVYSTNPELFMKEEKSEAPGGLPPKGQVIKIRRESNGRAGKMVTALFELQASERQLEELVKALKRSLGTGGTAKAGRVELQGDQLVKAMAWLEKQGYKPKRAGA